MFFSRMENFLEKNIEGFFNRKFSSNLQMAEIEKIIRLINVLGLNLLVEKRE